MEASTEVQAGHERNCRWSVALRVQLGELDHRQVARSFPSEATAGEWGRRTVERLVARLAAPGEAVC